MSWQDADDRIDWVQHERDTAAVVKEYHRNKNKALKKAKKLMENYPKTESILKELSKYYLFSNDAFRELLKDIDGMNKQPEEDDDEHRY